MKNNIKKIRTEKQMTLLELSRLTGISVGYLCHLERGSRSNPSLDKMEKISKALNEKISKVFLL